MQRLISLPDPYRTTILPIPDHIQTYNKDLEEFYLKHNVYGDTMLLTITIERIEKLLGKNFDILCKEVKDYWKTLTPNSFRENPGCGLCIAAVQVAIGFKSGYAQRGGNAYGEHFQDKLQFEEDDDRRGPYLYGSPSHWSIEKGGTLQDAIWKNLGNYILDAHTLELDLPNEKTGHNRFYQYPKHHRLLGEVELDCFANSYLKLNLVPSGSLTAGGLMDLFSQNWQKLESTFPKHFAKRFKEDNAKKDVDKRRAIYGRIIIQHYQKWDGSTTSELTETTSTNKLERKPHTPVKLEYHENEWNFFREAEDQYEEIAPEDIATKIGDRLWCYELDSSGYETYRPTVRQREDQRNMLLLGNENALYKGCPEYITRTDKISRYAIGSLTIIKFESYAALRSVYKHIDLYSYHPYPELIYGLRIGYRRYLEGHGPHVTASEGIEWKKRVIGSGWIANYDPATAKPGTYQLRTDDQMLTFHIVPADEWEAPERQPNEGFDFGTWSYNTEQPMIDGLWIKTLLAPASKRISPTRRQLLGGVANPKLIQKLPLYGKV